ncbi:MAG: hypothetical protein AAF532_09005 [Planctomycetota bacterium]
MRHRFSAFAFAFAFAAFVPAALVADASADELDFSEIPADAEWVAHLDAEAFLDSRIGAALFAWWDESGDSGKARMVAELFSVDLEEDVRSVTLFDDGYGEDEQVVLIDADVDTDWLLRFVAFFPDHRIETVDGVEVHSWWDEGRNRPVFGTVADEVVVVASTAADVAWAGGVLAGRSKSVADARGPLAFDAADAIVAVGFGRPPAERLPKRIDLPEGVGPVSVCFDQSDDAVHMIGRLAAEADVVRRVEDVCRGVVAFGRMIVGDAADGAELIRELADAASVRRDGDAVVVETRLSEATLFDSVE